MRIPFYKYHGTGNDFVLVDQRDQQWIGKENQSLVQAICSRRFGVGADGLILIENHSQFDFEMIYFNSDGQLSSMCGNGGRCAVAFAHHLGMIHEKANFLAVDGGHEARIGSNSKIVHLNMSDVPTHTRDGEAYVLNTGSPHFVSINRDVSNVDVVREGKEIRYNATYKDAGINVNFIAAYKNGIFVRTYERGVEDETYSCGTGVVASAIAWSLEKQEACQLPLKIYTLGGELEVSFDKSTTKEISNIILSGPTTPVFKGHWQT